jgi:hypothetical protein
LGEIYPRGLCCVRGHDRFMRDGLVLGGGRSGAGGITRCSDGMPASWAGNRDAAISMFPLPALSCREPRPRTSCHLERSTNRLMDARSHCPRLSTGRGCLRLNSAVSTCGDSDRRVGGCVSGWRRMTPVRPKRFMARGCGDKAAGTMIRQPTVRQLPSRSEGTPFRGRCARCGSQWIV